jgi:small subunit ribosomal protein S20
MPNTKSANKAMRQSRRRNAINLRTRSKFKSAVKETRAIIATGDAKESATSLKKAMSALDKAVKKNVMHKNTASRKKSRLAKAIAKIEKK